MDWFDREVLQFVLWWKPFGRPHEEDVFPRFGMDVRQLADRFARIVAELDRCADQLDRADFDLLTRARDHLIAGRLPPARYRVDPAVRKKY